MLITEAEWLATAVGDDLVPLPSVVLNLGSSTATFRKQVQPFIHSVLFAPIEQKGAAVFHSDLKDEDGETISADITNAADFERLQGLGAGLIFCTNMLEHVESIELMISRLSELTPPDGLLALTVPHSYPYHPDPIDNGFRPNLNEVVRLFPDFCLIRGAVVTGPTLLEEFRNRPTRILKQLARCMLPWPNFRGWMTAMDRWRWLVRPYKVTCVVLRRVRSK